MPTLNEMIYNIRNTASGGRSHRALTYSDRQIAFWIKACRAFLIYADIKNKGGVHPQFEQDLGCVRLQEVDQADCIGAEWGDNVKFAPLPQLIDVTEIKRNVNFLSFFGLIDKVTHIPIADQGYGSLQDYQLFVPLNKKKAKIVGNKIYVYNAEDLCWVNIRGVFADPTMVDVCSSTTSEPVCYDQNNDCYPVPAHLEQSLYDMVFEKYINIAAKVPEDTLNNEKRDSVL